MDEKFRQEFIKRLDGGTPLKQDELLEILLENANGVRDTSEISKRLTDVFPGVGAILNADYEELIAAGAPEAVACYLKTLGRNLDVDGDAVYIRNTEECFSFIDGRLKVRDVEFVELYLLNKAYKLTEALSFTSNFADAVNVSVAEVLSALSARNVFGVYLAHNHVNCAVTPSEVDDRVTKKISDACRLCGIKFFDHCIINSAGDTFSYKQSGRLPQVIIKGSV